MTETKKELILTLNIYDDSHLFSTPTLIKVVSFKHSGMFVHGYTVVQYVLNMFPTYTFPKYRLDGNILYGDEILVFDGVNTMMIGNGDNGVYFKHLWTNTIAITLEQKPNNDK